MTKRKSYFPHIDGLRMVAVVGVLLAHFHITGFDGGFLGVDVFFVISGFLITRLIIQERGRTGTFSYSRFYVRRIRRLMPAALFVIAATLIAFFPILGERDLVSLLRSVPFAIFSLSNVNFFMEIGYFDTSARFKPLLHTWSLSVEEQFYFIWPTIILLLLRLKKWLLLASTLLMILSLLGAAIIRPENFSAAYYLLPFRAFELLLGAMLAAIMAPQSPDFRDIQCLPKSVMAFLAWLGMAMIMASFVFFDESSALPGLASLVPCIGTALIIAYGSFGGVGRFLTWRPVVWVGLISYSLYLVHWPLWVYLIYRTPSEPSLALSLAMLPASILLATVSYYLVEQPFRQPKDGKMTNVPFILSTVVTSCLLILPTAVYKFGFRPVPTLIAEYRTEYFGPAPYDEVILSGAAGQYNTKRWSGGERSPRILVLGDSHAGHLLSGIREVLAPLGYNVDLVHATGCPPLAGITIYRETDAAPDKGCETLNRGLMNLLESNQYDTVILASYWALGVGDYNLPSQKLRHIDYVEVGDTLPTRGIENTRRLFKTQIEETVERLREGGKKVVILSQIPNPGINLSQCQSLLTNAATSGGRCAPLSRDEIEARLAYSNSTLKMQGNKPDVLYIDATELMCSAEACLFDSPTSGEHLYDDDNHLSTVGSAYFMNALVKRTRVLVFIDG